MAIKKSELYSSLWQSCDELRGSMDASQYKDYVLVLLFMKYVSDKYAGQKRALLEVPKGGGFADMVALKGNKDIGEKINKIIAKLAEANEQLKGAIDVADFNEPDKLGKGPAMVARLTNLISIFENPNLDFQSNRAEGDDILGDAYEYLMRHFATESGKSKGQFYTPAEVSRVMAKVINIASAKSSAQTIHDPACGSGSLLLKAHDEAKNSTGHDLTIYGQEMDNATAALAKMNMVLHGCPSAEIWKDNTLSTPHFKDAKTNKLKTFDFVVANPPFSTKAWSSGFDPEQDEFRRFAYGIPPKKNGDYAFLLHVLATLKSTGRGAVIMPHGVLFRGNVEADIRRNIARQGYIKGIIGLPANLFFGTSISACIIVLDKEDAVTRKGIFMVDASKGFIKEGRKNRLRAQDIHKIVDTFTRQIMSHGYSRFVPYAEIEKNEFNLNLPRYIDSTEPEDLQDIDGHLRGGIPERDIDALNRYWQVIPSVRATLFKIADRPGYTQLKVATSEIKAVIYGHEEFTAFNTFATKLFTKWKTTNTERLKGIGKGTKPKAFVETISEALLNTFEKAPLIDSYDVYQHLMDYWAETMQDDCYIVSADGWKGGARVREVLQVKNKDDKKVWPEAHDYKKGKRRFKSDLIPASILIARYFVAEREGIQAIEAALAANEQQLDEQMDELGGDGGLLDEVIEGEGDKRKITAKAVKARLKVIGKDPDFTDERIALESYSALLEKQSHEKSCLKHAVESLDRKIETKYPVLTEDEIKILVVDDKWIATLAAAVQGELARVSQTLTSRIWELAERYATPLPGLTGEVATLAARVDAHLKSMGAVWK